MNETAKGNKLTRKKEKGTTHHSYLQHMSVTPFACLLLLRQILLLLLLQCLFLLLLLLHPRDPRGGWSPARFFNWVLILCFHGLRPVRPQLFFLQFFLMFFPLLLICPTIFLIVVPIDCSSVFGQLIFSCLLVVPLDFPVVVPFVLPIVL